MKNNNYVNVVYSKDSHPPSSYPQDLVNYILQRFNIKKDSILLDTGTGSRVFMDAFENKGLICYGTDLDIYDEKKVFKVDLENEKLPFPDNYFDVIWSKSMLEHLHNPEFYMKEIYRTLKPGGKFIVLVPNWLTSIYLYYFDHSHKQPYTEEALGNLLKISGFVDVHTEEFFQLQSVWKYPILKVVCKFLQIFGSPKKIVKNKFLRWSRETMILSVSTKK